MRHHSRRALSDQQNVLNMYNSNSKAKVKPCNTGISAPCHSSVCSSNKTEEHYSVPQKTKRLKTIKQRNQIRRQNSNRIKQHIQHCERGSKNKRPCNECQDSHCRCSLNVSVKEKAVAKPFPSQKPSIITEGRLTSMRGLFSHEVRSVDIERLVQEKKHHKHSEKQEGHTITSNSPTPPCVIPHSTSPAVIAETSEEGISASANKDQELQKTDHLQTNLDETDAVILHSGDENHISTQIPKTTDNTVRSASPSDQKGVQEALSLSSSESESAHKSFPTSFKVSKIDYKAILKKKNTHIQKKTVAMDLQPDFVNSERLGIPAGLEVLNLVVPQFDPSPTIFSFSSPTMDGKRNALRDKSQHSKPGFSSKDEAVSRLTARLCHDLGSFPLQRHCPLLTDCSKVLLHHLQERHGSQLHHNLHRLHSHLSADRPNFPHTAEQVWPTKVQTYLDNKQKHFSYTRKHEDDQQSEIMEFQTDNGSENEGFCENVDREAAIKRQRKQTWGILSPQDFVTKLQQPCPDTLGQWNNTAQSQEFLTAMPHSKSQTFSLHQAFTTSQIPTPWSCSDRILDPYFLEPQKQVKLSSGENRRRHSTVLPLLEQWRNDPDLNFLFQDEKSKSTHTSFGSPTQLRNRSSDPDTKSVSERLLSGASSTVSAFFPPEGFCYEPYFRFPHPSNSFNRSEKSTTSLYAHPDVEKQRLEPSLHSTNLYF